MSDSISSDDSVLLTIPDDPNLGVCRLCNKTSELSSLLVPCLCTSVSPYTHRVCLDSWRAFNLDGHSFLHCHQCQTPYRFRPVHDSDDAAAERMRRWQAHSSVFISTVCVVFLSALLFLTVFVNACDLSNSLPPHFPSLSPLLCYLLVGFLLLVGLLTVSGIVAYSYGLHLPVQYRANWRLTPADYAFEPNRHHFLFCFHPDLFCYSCYGLQYEYAMLSNHSRGSEFADLCLLVSMVLATWLVGLFFGSAVALYVLYRTGRRYIDMLRLRQLTAKYVVVDIREEGGEAALSSGEAADVSLKTVEAVGKEAEAGRLVKFSRADEKIDAMATQQLAVFVGDDAASEKPPQQNGGDGSAAVVSSAAGGSDGSSDGGKEDEAGLDKWRWEEAVSDEDDDDEDAKGAGLGEWMDEREDEGAQQEPLRDWVGSSESAEAAVEAVGETMPEERKEEPEHERAIPDM